MGKKGDKSTQGSVISAELVVNNLAGIGHISSKNMFGGNGIFHDGKMFCIIDSKGVIFMKVNEITKPDFEAKGMQQHSRMPYYAVPEDILNNQSEFIAWAEKAITIAK